MLVTLLIVVAVIFVVVIFNKNKNQGITQVNVSEAEALVKDPGLTLIDVRSPREFSEGHIEGAKLIPVNELNGRLTEIESLKKKRILVYCHAGSRSASASQILKNNGFTRVSNLKGGITAWKATGLKVVK
jgi:rhodanese-related sulfurtransferase